MVMIPEKIQKKSKMPKSPVFREYEVNRQSKMVDEKNYRQMKRQMKKGR